MPTPKTRFGGSFAPPLTHESLVAYKLLSSACEDVKASGYMKNLIKMVEVFNETPASKEAGSPHPSGLGIEVPLEADEVKRIWDCVPWSEECDVIGKAFDVLKGDTRRAAYHLLWYARELTVDREPITTDKL